MEKIIGGSGFLKLIGMPFRMLLNESESMRHILMHRQSAQSMAGLRALHIVRKWVRELHMEYFKENEGNCSGKVLILGESFGHPIPSISFSFLHLFPLLFVSPMAHFRLSPLSPKVIILGHKFFWRPILATIFCCPSQNIRWHQM